MYVLKFKPRARIEGARAGEMQCESASEALKVATNLIRSDELVEIFTSEGAQVSIGHLEHLARSE